MAAKSRSPGANIGAKLGGTDSPTHFFKIILPSTLEVQKLKIPVKFAKKFGNELSQVATIKVPNGRSWKLGLEEAENRICFVDGWQRFVKYYSIDSGYFLVFKYKKFSTFHACIFDMSATEIKYPSEPKVKTEDHKESEHDDDGFEILESKPNIFSRNRVSTESAGQQSGRKRKEVGESSDSLNCKIPSENKKYCQADKVKENMLHCPNVFPTNNEDENEMVLFESKIFSSTIRSKESERAIEAARSCKRSNPSFIVELGKTNIAYGFVNVPAEFVVKYLRSCSDFIKVETVDGRQWNVCCTLLNGSRSVKRICKGWSHLVKDYNLKVGDVCVFELMKHKDYILLKVFIYYAADYADPAIQVLE